MSNPLQWLSCNYCALKELIAVKDELLAEASATDLEQAYGSITAEGNAAANTISAASTDFSNKVQLTGFGTNGAAVNTIPDHTQDHITIREPGVYRVALNASISGGATDTYSASVFKNNGATKIAPRATVTLAVAGSQQLSTHAILSLSLNDTIEAWIQNETDTDNVTIEDGVLSVERIA